MFHSELLKQVDREKGIINGVDPVARHLSDLNGSFADKKSFQTALIEENRFIYHLSSVETSGKPGNMYYGLGYIQPGKIGEEYFCTKGHIHKKRESAEFYFCLSGQGVMLLEDEKSGEDRMIEFGPHSIIYVPGYTAHRTCNVGKVPLLYLGIYPCDAGLDYGHLKQKNFNSVVIDTPHGAQMIERKRYMKMLKNHHF